MNALSRHSSQARLYGFNRGRLLNPALASGADLTFETEWMAANLQSLSGSASPQDLAGLLTALDGLITQEAAQQPESSLYVASCMTRNEFKVLVQEFAIDGLTEAQVFYFILPRLPLAAQMPMLRILIDEFGSGNLKRAHTTLYIALLRELDMPVDIAHYCDHVEPTSFAFVNLFFWLTLRADDPSYFAGALTYLESAIPSFFECYVQACDRLGVAAHAYYSEHRHIDVFHAQEGRRMLWAMATDQALDVTKAWVGIQLASRITGTAFEEAVAKARSHGLVRSEPQGEVSC